MYDLNFDKNSYGLNHDENSSSTIDAVPGSLRAAMMASIFSLYFLTGIRGSEDIAKIRSSPYYLSVMKRCQSLGLAYLSRACLCCLSHSGVYDACTCSFA